MAKRKTGADKDAAANKDAAPAPVARNAAVPVAAAAPAPPTAEEKAAAEAERERREKRVVEANEKAMRDGQVAPTINGQTGVVHTKDGVVIFNTGEFAFVPLHKVPTWFLHHLMADAVDHLKWRVLTKEQQTEVKNELTSRQAPVDQSKFPPSQGAGAVSDLETVQERRAKEASPIAVGSGPQTPTFGEADSKGRGTGTVGGPTGLPEVSGASRKATDKAIDKSADEGSVPPGAGEAAKGGVTGVDADKVADGASEAGGAKRKTSRRKTADKAPK